MSKTAAQRERFTEGALLWPLLTLAAPLVGSQMLQVVYNLTDTFWVGRLGADAVSALSFAWVLVSLIISLGSGFTMAGTILISQNIGAGNNTPVGHVAGQSLSFTVLIAVGLSVAGYAIAPNLLTLIGTEAGTPIHTMATSYIQIMFLGAPLLFGFFIFQALLRGWGDTTTPMYLMAGGVGVNILIDPLFILGFQSNPLFAGNWLTGLESTLYTLTGFDGLGVQGAAIATVLSQGIAAAIGLWLLFSDRVGIHIRVADLRPRLATVRKIVRIGTPAGIEASTQALSATVMTALVATISADAVAGYGIGYRITSLVWLPTVAMGMAVETIVGQNLGANRINRVKRVVLLSAGTLFTIYAVISALFVIFAEPIIGLFVTGENASAVVEFGTGYLSIVAPTYAIMAIFHMINGGFHGAGSTRLSMVVSLTSLWGVRILGAATFLIVFALGTPGVWYGIAVSNVTAAIVGGIFFLRGTWADSVVDNEGDESDIGNAEGSDESNPVSIDD